MSGVYFTNRYKEPQMRKVANGVLDIVGIVVSTQQMYNHVSKWRLKWSVISTMKNEGNSIDVLDFAGIAVTTQQMYHHIRKWRLKWIVISTMKNEGKLKWCDADTCLVL
jgi:hypothetical protein